MSVKVQVGKDKVSVESLSAEQIKQLLASNNTPKKTKQKLLNYMRCT